MIISNKELSKILLQSDIPTNDLVNYFHIIIKLIKKYWSKIFTTKTIKNIQSIDSQISTLLEIIQKYNKNNISEIKSLIKILKESQWYIPSFEVNMIEMSEKYYIHQKLKSKFQKSNIKTNKNIDLWIFVSWEWRYYKRNIDQDLEKIL